MANTKDSMEMNPEDVAIIGMACRFPKAAHIEEFWKRLQGGEECITRLTKEQLSSAGTLPEEYKHPAYVPAGGFLEDIDCFDYRFFGYSPNEAALIDPQQRLFLEQAWLALEDANCDPEAFPGLIGVYTSIGINTYLYHNLMPHRKLLENSGGYPVMTSGDKDFLATRVSYKLNLKGPGMTIQTAGSSSMVAVHCACQALRNGECDAALTGGVSVIIPHGTGYRYQEGLILLPDGPCRAFDEDAMGTVLGSGAGAVVLKRLSNALKDGDRIYAVIKGSALNNNDSSRAGYTEPEPESQAAAVYEAMSAAGVAPEDITYIETHGTGTHIGDSIELAALNRAFMMLAKDNVQPGTCAIGSVRTNIGHLDAAAGIAGLIKTALALRQRQIPPSLNFRKTGQGIPLEGTPFYVNSELKEWKKKGAARYAGISSFGIDGTNACMILSEAPPGLEHSPVKSRFVLLNLSAKSPSALQKKAEDMSRWLTEHPEEDMYHIGAALTLCRKKMPYRLSAVCRSREEAAAILQDRADRPIYPGEVKKEGKKLAFVFPGQGSQYINMGKELYLNEAVFRETMDTCFRAYSRLLGIDFKKVLFPDSDPLKEAEADALLRRTLFTQTSLFAVEYSLAKLLISKGVVPGAVTGHSLGEYAAACLAGVFSLEEGLELVAVRGRLIDGLPEGSMYMAEIGEEAIKPYIEARKEVSLAAVNGYRHCVISGESRLVASVAEQLEHKGFSGKYLSVSHAFHSPMLYPVIRQLRELLDRIQFKPPGLPYLSSCTGEWGTDIANPAYWEKQLCETVRFRQVSDRLLRDTDMVLLEIGPGKTLSALLHRHPESGEDRIIINTMPHPKEKNDAEFFLYKTFARLFAGGGDVDWKTFFGNQTFSWTALPGYPFDRMKCWISPDGDGTAEIDTEAAVSFRTRILPINPMEEFIATLWKEILGICAIGVTDNFFELGGTSLMITQVIAGITERFGKVSFTVEDMYKYQTVRQLAAYIYALCALQEKAPDAI